MDALDLAFEVIDMRSFSNLWYWIALAVQWSMVSHWVLGVPHDMIQNAHGGGEQAQKDVEDLVRINIARLLHIVDRGSLTVVGIGAFWFSTLAMLAFYYQFEFAQALLFLLAPLSLVVLVSIRTGHKILAGEERGELLLRRLTVHRRIIQVIGMVSISATAAYGTWRNISVSVLH